MNRLAKLIVSSLLLLLVACQQDTGYVRLDGFTMGTTYQVTFEKKQHNPELLQKAIDERLQQINQLMSTYIDDSELSLFNQSTRTDCQALSAETYYVIKNAIQISQWTGGKFDVTLGPLIEIWGFDKKDTHNVVPDQATVQALLKDFGFDNLHLGEHCVSKQLPHLSVNLSAIAKGYGVDEIGRLIAAQGITNYLVEIGGEIANRGVNPNGKPWRIAIESAESASRSVQRTLTPDGLGMATSGSYRNYFEKDGKRFSHTIDPTTGYPITHQLASVTVLHPETMIADALATAMMVMGPEETLTFANQRNLPVFMLVKTDNGFNEVYSQAFEDYLQ